MMGGALGLAVLASVAAARSGADPSLPALVEGYHAAFIVGTVFAAAGAILAATLLRERREPAVEAGPAVDCA
jgi:hypothetical protein